jgi:PAS domain S-box-containing protein
LDADGTLLGHLAVLDNRPMPAEPQLYELFDLFAVRAVAELRRLRAEAAMREREAQLALLLDTAMDAILVLDAEFKITRLNPRARELFACMEEDLAGKNFLGFLSSTAAAKFSRLAKELQARPGESSLVAGRVGGNPLGQTPVPAEAAISRYLYNGVAYYTVFLRSSSQPEKVLNSVELQELEKRNLLRALETCGWKISGVNGVSAIMGLPPSTVSSRMKALGIRRV